MEAKDSGRDDPWSSLGECTRTRTERNTTTATTPVNRHYETTRASSGGASFPPPPRIFRAGALVSGPAGLLGQGRVRGGRMVGWGLPGTTAPFRAGLLERARTVLRGAHHLARLRDP